MKITVRQRMKDIEKVAFKDLKAGTVYKIDIGVTLLKLNGEEAVILKDSSGRDWLNMAGKGPGNFHGMPATKILGKLIEIVVKPNDC